MHTQINNEEVNETTGVKIIKWLAVVGLIWALLVSVGMIGSGFKIAAGDQAKQLFELASNPFAGLVIGTVATALIQSSSTVTSIIVALVAGGLPVGIAIPMIMGANIGTTITNTLVSLGFMRDGKEFRRAFAAATVHDFFNLICVVIFLPLELFFRPLERLSALIVQPLLNSGSLSIKGLNFMKPITKPPVEAYKGLLEGFSSTVMGVVLAVTGIIVSGITSGTVVTTLVQSSSTTTSLVVPLVGTGVFNLRQIYPFCLGANIGTCITALLAATAIVGDNAIFALQIAVVHFIYNTLGVIIIYGVPFLREIPIKAAEWLAELASQRKIYALVYVIGVFFVIPAAMIAVSSGFDSQNTETEESSAESANAES